MNTEELKPLFETVEEFQIAMLEGCKFKDGDGYIYYADSEKYGPKSFRVDIGDGKNVELYKFPNLAYLTEITETTPWYENIPEGGVLCWVWYGDEKEKTKTIIKFYLNCDSHPFQNEFGIWRNARPLTPEEAMNLVYQAEIHKTLED